MEMHIETEDFVMHMQDFECRRNYKCESCPSRKMCDDAIEICENWKEAVSAGIDEFL